MKTLPYRFAKKFNIKLALGMPVCVPPAPGPRQSRCLFGGTLRGGSSQAAGGPTHVARGLEPFEHDTAAALKR